MSTVLGVAPWKDAWFVTLDDKTDNIICFDSAAADLKAHEPLPEGWSVEISKKGKPYLKTPNGSQNSSQNGSGGSRSNAKGFGATSWYNSEEGVRFTQERTDRRTALMQAVTATGDPGHWEPAAIAMYAWLRSTSENPVAKAPASNGVEERGTLALPQAQASPSLLDLLYVKYGNGPKVLQAARAFYADSQPPSAISDLTEERMQELLARA